MVELFVEDEADLLEFFSDNVELMYEFLELLPYKMTPTFYDANLIIHWLINHGYIR